MCAYHSGITRGDALRVLIVASETLAELLGEGCSVSLDEWGTFKATIGLEPDKEMDTIDGDEPKRNARSHCKLERAGVSRVRRSPYTKEERLQKALDYLEEHKVLKVAQYMELTGQGHTTSACELRAFSRDTSSGIVAIGRGSSVVYVKGSCDQR